ncbi:hypothetical protein KR032_003832, partial [Drosophila birchii]
RYEDTSHNCTLPAILEFPPFMRRKAWWVIALCSFLSIYIFLILAIVCDDYLLPAMERLCYALKMSYDVAGATFLAASTSAPELFINIVGTFITHSDIGIGTIVGSSVFNVLVICAVCGIFTNPMKLNWWPVTRDTFWYLVAIFALVAVMWDSCVRWYESVALLLLYVVYFLQLWLDKKIKKLFRSNKENPEEEQGQIDPMSVEGPEEVKTFRSHVWGVPEKGSKCWMWLWWTFKYPAELMLALTIPNARTIYPLTMIMAVVWISLVSYLVTWFITVIGHNVGIPDSIMGLTFLAAGTSVPEIVSSYIVSKKGHGAMAICNAVGSNTFDILICLGLPWTLQVFTEGVIYFESSALNITTSMLILTAVIMYLALVACRFTLGKIVGWVCLISYIAYIVIACVLEMVLKTVIICDIES